MKKIIFVFLFVLPLFISAQNYFTIPCDSTSEWRVKKIDLSKSYCLEINDLLYHFNGDTTINFVTYKKLYKSGIQYEEAYGNISCDTNIYHFQNINIGGIRNDSKKVYFYSYNSNIEVLLFDFTLNIGDTIPGFYDFSMLNTTILSIDSVLINNHYHKRFNMQNGHWNIEGIGSDMGLIESLGISLDGSSDFLCYAEKHIPVFPNGTNCILNVNVEEHLISTNNHVMIFPNPSSNFITIYFQEIQKSEFEIEIYNITGKKVKSLKFKGKSSAVVNVTDFPHGLYLGKIFNSNSFIQTFKFVVE